MIRSLDDVQRRAVAKAATHRLEQPELGEIVAGPLKEQHRHLDGAQVLGTGVAGALGGMKRKAEEDEPAHAGQRLLRLRVGGHPPAQGFSPRHERQPRRRAGRRGDGRADGGFEHARRIGAARLRLHVRKLVPQGGDPSPGQGACDGCEEGMTHARPRAVGQHVQEPGVRRALQQRRHPTHALPDDELELLRFERYFARSRYLPSRGSTRTR